MRTYPRHWSLFLWSILILWPVRYLLSFQILRLTLHRWQIKFPIPHVEAIIHQDLIPNTPINVTLQQKFPRAFFPKKLRNTPVTSKASKCPCVSKNKQRLKAYISASCPVQTSRQSWALETPGVHQPRCLFITYAPGTIMRACALALFSPQDFNYQTFNTCGGPPNRDARQRPQPKLKPMM